MDYSTPLHDVFRVEDEPLANPIREFGRESVKRCVGLVSPALDLYGRYLSVAPYEEVHLHLVPVRFGVSARIKEESSASCYKALCNSVFRNHAAVEAHIAREYRPVDIAIRYALFAERMRHEKTRVGHVKFPRRKI